MLWISGWKSDRMIRGTALVVMINVGNDKLFMRCLLEFLM